MSANIVTAIANSRAATLAELDDAELHGVNVDRFLVRVDLINDAFVLIERRHLPADFSLTEAD